MDELAVYLVGLSMLAGMVWFAVLARYRLDGPAWLLGALVMGWLCWTLWRAWRRGRRVR